MIRSLVTLCFAAERWIHITRVPSFCRSKGHALKSRSIQEQQIPMISRCTRYERVEKLLAITVSKLRQLIQRLVKGETEVAR